MIYEERIQNVTVLGAAGKMGSGILLLTAVEMADLSLKPENKDKQFVLNAMDVSPKALSGLMLYLRTQVLKIAEKKVVALRKLYENHADLIDNAEIIDRYVFDVLNVVRPVTTIESAYNSTMVFEAINENEDLKVKLFSQIDENNPNKPWFFTNTSSIPIYILNNRANLDGRVIGFHFYNPPAVQKLVEIICADQTKPELLEFATNYAKNLKKTIVFSNDIAGFIGNGHFMRDILYAVSEVERLNQEMSFVEAVYTVNKVCQDYLVRPMGIFQLIDYVGIDVCQFIMKVMRPHIKDEIIHCELLDKMMALNVKGGQNSDGSQKDGFIKYEKNRPVAFYSIESESYVQTTEFQAKCDARIVAESASLAVWKNVVSSPTKHELLSKHFEELKSMQTLGVQLAIAYAQKSKEIGLKLVADNVAKSHEDVNTVMLTGFFHAYGPINNY